jgi:hypothetical protein
MDCAADDSETMDCRRSQPQIRSPSLTKDPVKLFRERKLQMSDPSLIFPIQLLVNEPSDMESLKLLLTED